jgi:hypothetical protein
MSADLETICRMFYRMSGFEVYWSFEQMPGWLKPRYWPWEPDFNPFEVTP